MTTMTVMLLLVEVMIPLAIFQWLHHYPCRMIPGVNFLDPASSFATTIGIPTHVFSTAR